MPRKRFHQLRARWSEHLDESRIRLARPDALLQLALLGLLTGVLAGGVIVLFRMLVEGSQEALLPGDGPENYESLPLWARLLLPLLGALALAALFRWLSGGLYVLGVARVMERMAYHQGRMTARGFMLQFVGAVLAIVSGHSVGREGPHIFLGAAAGSLLGQHLRLPNNALRTLVGCGTAAGIAASFNTPLAGVVFALEVVMMEYSVASFIPIILAAVSATTLSNAVLGDHPAFAMPALQIGALSELMLVAILGVLAGVASAAFIHAVQRIAERAKPIPIAWRMLLAGLGVGLFGMALPQVMGIGYDTVAAALAGELGPAMLLGLLVAKLLVSALCIGLGVPGGMIGPVVFIGAMLGGLLANLVVLLPFHLDSHVGFFALLGMGAMMAGSLQAPLAALTAMLELTDNPEIILPGMLAVVLSGITASEVFRKESLFVSMLKASGLDYSANPMSQALRRVGVASVMERRFVHVDADISLALAREMLAQEPVYILIDRENRPALLMPAVELAKYLESRDPNSTVDRVDLYAIPAARLQVEPVDLQANLHEAWSQLELAGVEALYVERTTASGGVRIFGVLTVDMIDKAYR